MRRWGWLIPMLFAATIGCKPEPPPVLEAKKIEEPAKESELKPPAKPSVSEPAAAQLLREVLAAHTGGDSSKLKVFRSCSFTRKGIIETPNGLPPTTWQMELQVPDRFRLRSEMKFFPERTIKATYVMDGERGWAASELPKAETKAMDAETLATFTSEYRESCTLFLFPLTEANTVVQRATDDGDLLGLHVWTPQLDYALLGIDKKSKLVSRVVYLGRESNIPVTKEVVIRNYQEFAGVKLGSQVLVQSRGRVLAEWTSLEVETGKPLDPKIFEKP